MEADYAVLNSVVHACRSLINDYPVKNAVIYLSVGKSYSLLKQEEDIVQNLVKGLKTLHVRPMNESIESGCALYVVSDDINAYLLVKGHVDFDVEIKKFEAKLEKNREAMAVVVKKTQATDYETKVNAKVREANSTKINALELEREALEKTRDDFQKLAA